jgi:hypothetical protein
MERAFRPVARSRFAGWASLAAALLLAAASAAPASTCEGDCDGGGTVSIDELVTAVSIALGTATVDSCTAADRDGDGNVSIAELVAAVGAALNGCGSMPDPEALRASTAVAASPLVTVLDFGSVGAGSAAGAARASLARPAQSSGCITYGCFLNGLQTGIQTVCCIDTQYTYQVDNCVFDDLDGNIVEQNGQAILTSDDPNVCSGTIPFGQSFSAEFDFLETRVTDPSGGVIYTGQNYIETFDAAQPGCSAQEPDEFGFAIRGDGTRQLDGARRLIVGDVSGAISTDLQTLTDGVVIDVSSQTFEGVCEVTAEINGTIEVQDSLTGSDVTSSFSAFGVAQAHTGNDVALAYQGTINTNCLGEVTVGTIEGLHLHQDDPCPIGGSVRLDLAAGSSIVTFTPTGGVELDFGADGSVDERFDRCEQLQVQQCTFQPPAGVCDPCNDSNDCTGDLQCYPCSFACQPSAQSRCSLSDDFVTCEDGVY